MNISSDDDMIVDYQPVIRANDKKLNGRAEVKSTIRKFVQVKIFELDANDSYFKKYSLLANNGCLKIYLNETTNKIYLLFYSIDAVTKLKTIHGDVSLNDVRYKLIRLNYVNENVKTSDRFEFVRRKVNSKEKNFSIEFTNGDFYDELESTLNSLCEAYPNFDDDRYNDDDDDDNDQIYYQKEPAVKNLTNRHNDVIKIDNEIELKKAGYEFFCTQLEKSIRTGDLDKSAFYAQKLAALKANVSIIVNGNSLTRSDSVLVIEPNETENMGMENGHKEMLKDNNNNNIQINQKKRKKLNKVIVTHKNDDFEDLNRLELSLDASETTVLDLKEQISKFFKMRPEEQLVFVNDCSANDNYLLSAYSKLRKKSTMVNGHASNYVMDEDILDDEIIVCVLHINPDNKDSKATPGGAAEMNEFKKNLLEEARSMNIPEKDENAEENYTKLAALYNQELSENTEPFRCDICLEDDVPPGQGVVLKECLHVFCKECLKNHVNNYDDPIVKCPYRNDYDCNYNLQEREIRALLDDEDFKKFQLKSLRRSEATMQNTFHCLTPNCDGFCVNEDNLLNFFDCPVCEKVNCLNCNVIHMGKDCKEYQEDLKIAAVNDKNAKKDKDALDKLVATKKAMYCPGCKIIVCKQAGCDWLQCAMCKTEICWATRGPRWGPAGRGDTSGGCKCNFAAQKPCHPNCQNCH